MGMFDEITCAYPLPGDIPDWIHGTVFQTKSFGCTLEQYHIDEDGYLLDPNGEEVMSYEWAYTGIICFYTTNLVGSGPDGIRLAKGHTDPYSVDFAAKVVDGQVEELILLREDHFEDRQVLER